jgi:tartrate dehydrogenase/decarboxylase/D-malate dehydrogenase
MTGSPMTESAAAPASRAADRTYRIAVIAGDGIGTEVMPEGLRSLRAAADRFGFRLEIEEFDWASAGYWQAHGAMLPDDWKDTLSGFDAIFFGAVGWPDVVPDHVSLWGSLLQFRRHFDQYVNLRPVKLLAGVPSPLAGRRPGDVDFFVVRENTEGEYSSVGGKMFEGTDRETVIQETVMTRTGVDRVLRYAFELADRRGGGPGSTGRPQRRHLTSATKSNGIAITMPYWDERVAAMAESYPEVEVDQFHIDILTANFVMHPDWFDVVVASNLFGDILSDLGPACTGTIGIAPSANINPEGAFPSLFEPVHGSAPDIAGRGIANPVGQIWSGALMLDHLGEAEAAAAVQAAFEAVLAGGDAEVLTPDMGGRGTTAALGAAVAEAIAGGR